MARKVRVRVTQFAGPIEVHPGEIPSLRAQGYLTEVLGDEPAATPPTATPPAGAAAAAAASSPPPGDPDGGADTAPSAGGKRKPAGT